ncbi:rCG62740 [Rattus norvegicus]|uniref:RCG62740 n=1 Tax=Rattus norvegicus TaxID=10116 RepID=A6J5J6_RAT|nr:rCG62740 [Rattus norvegicus]
METAGSKQPAERRPGPSDASCRPRSAQPRPPAAPVPTGSALRREVSPAEANCLELMYSSHHPAVTWQPHTRKPAE